MSQAPVLLRSAFTMLFGFSLLVLKTSVFAQESGNYTELVKLHEDWRQFQKPPLLDGVPDYSPTAMNQQHRRLADYQRRLYRIDTTGWSTAEQVDFQLVWAEMNGMDFDHRVLRPWERMPAFYQMLFPSESDVPAREGPHVTGTIELWSYDFPLSREDAAEITAKMVTIPTLYDRARIYLTGVSRDLWIAGTKVIAGQSDNLADFKNELGDDHQELRTSIDAAMTASNSFVEWLETQAPDKTEPSGLGVANYNWYLRNVQLVPYTWQEEVTMLKRELARAHTSLRLEEHRNRNLPEQKPITDEAEYESRFKEDVARFMEFLEEAEAVTVEDYFEPALLAQMKPVKPLDEDPGFFSIVDYHDPIVMRTHHYHWIEKARIAESPHSSPIRSAALLYNIYDSRAEGLATGLEEMLMHAGLLDDRPRSRELVWILLAQRCARGLGSLYMHAQEWSMDEAAEFASRWTPRGWLPAEGRTIQGELHFYLTQPFYGTSYVTGKIQLEKLYAERALQLGDEMSLKRFLDDLNATGVIPVSMIHWEWTGSNPLN